MTSIREALKRIISPVKPLEPGFYSYTAPIEDPDNYRLHLRVEENGQGVLIVNASTILHLNQTATEYAYHLIKGDPDFSTIEEIGDRYKIANSQVADDYKSFKERIFTLISTPDLDPVMYLGFDRTRPFIQAKIPYRLDVALTYKLPEEHPPDLAPQERVSKELSTEEWKALIDIAWNRGVPQIVFTGGEPTLRQDLIELLEYCESHGMVTGLISGSSKCAEPDYLDKLLLSGLDHLMLVIDPAQESSWSALEKVLPADLFTAVHLTITPDNFEHFPEYLEKLKTLQPNAVSLSISDPKLDQQLADARELAADLGLDLVWELPVPYMHLNPVTLEVGENRVMDGAGHAWLYIEPDGDVLPDQTINKVLGNFLHDPIEEIYKNAMKN